jgi:hypothetical protein
MMAARWAEGFEQVGARLWPGFAGLILMEAVKQTFAVKPRGCRARPGCSRPSAAADPARRPRQPPHRAKLLQRKAFPPSIWI